MIATEYSAGFFLLSFYFYIILFIFYVCLLLIDDRQSHKAKVGLYFCIALLEP